MNTADKQDPCVNALIKERLSNLLPAPNGQSFAFASLNLMDSGISDLSALASLQFIQEINLGSNKVTDLNPLSNLAYLTRLYLSGNSLENIDHWLKIPQFIETLDLSNNKITSISGISRVKYLKQLNVDGNELEDLADIGKCQFLQVLSAQDNKITSLEQLSNPNLYQVNMSRNQLTSLKGIENLMLLQNLRLRGNQIEDLSLFSSACHQYIEYLDLGENNIKDMAQIDHLQRLESLVNLHIDNNPFQSEIPKYLSKVEEACMFNEISEASKVRLWLVFHVPAIEFLDNLPVTPEEKVKALNVFDPPAEYVTSLQFNLTLRNQVRQPAQLDLRPFKSVELYVPIVLCGRQSVGKRTLAKMLVQEFPQLFVAVPSYTTRPPKDHEANGKDYCFVSNEEMDSMFGMGKFVEIMKIGPHRYGITFDSIESIANSGRFALLSFELEGAILLKKAGITHKLAYLASERLGPIDSEKQRVEKLYGKADAFLVNDDVSQVFADLKKAVFEWINEFKRSSGIKTLSMSSL